MFEHFTEDEVERMHSFRETPPYERTPEQLLPEHARDDHNDGSTERVNTPE
jgi:hypothetical protein